MSSEAVRAFVVLSLCLCWGATRGRQSDGQVVEEGELCEAGLEEEKVLLPCSLHAEGNAMTRSEGRVQAVGVNVFAWRSHVTVRSHVPSPQRQV